MCSHEWQKRTKYYLSKYICPCKLSCFHCQIIFVANLIGLILSKVLLACLMHKNRKSRLAAAAALAKSVNVKNASTAENGGVMHSSPVALERYVAIHFPSFSLYMAVISVKKRSVCGCIIRQGNASQLVPTVQMPWSPLIPRKRGRGGGCCYKWLFMLFEKYIYSSGLTRKYTTQVKAGWLNRRFVL